jgi:hypothetical protein
MKNWKGNCMYLWQPVRCLCSALLAAAAIALLFISLPASGQTTTATLSGYAQDQTGAIIPGATAILTNQSSKDHRDTLANSAGIFTFTAVPAGTYTLSVSYPGFAGFIEKDIQLHPADKREITNVVMKVGTVSQTVTVTSASSAIDTTGARSALITADDIKRLPVQGRDVTELIKTLPGFAQLGASVGAAGSTADNIGPNSQQVGTGGSTANYAANGVSPQGISILSDGVDITDPGNGASTDQTINMDNVAEVKIQTSNFGADSAKGPIVINAVGKSGGTEYHGSVYTYGRAYPLNTQDWFSKYDNDPKPQDVDVYPGFNVGGPIKIPGTHFNHANKLTFFLGAEDYQQRNIYAYGSAEAATVQALVPTAQMRSGDFSQQSLESYFGQAVNSTTCATNPSAPLALYVNICGVPAGLTPPLPSTGSSLPIIGGMLPAAALNPNTMAIVNGLIPLPNRAPYGPTSNQIGGNGEQTIYNYSQVNLNNNNNYQGRIKIDDAISDNLKFFVQYDLQHSTSRVPQQLFYSPQTSFGEINTPGGILAGDYSHTASMNFTQVLSSSLTNEDFIGASLNFSGNKKPFPGAGLGSSIGYTQQGIYPQNPLAYPQLHDYNFDGLPLALYPDYSSGIFQHKFVVDGGDNLTKVWGLHTTKFGVYVERSTNNQTDLNISSNGQISQYYVGSNSGPGSVVEPAPPGGTGKVIPTPGNYLAAFMLGIIQEYSQNNFQTNSDLYYWTTSFYATDSWKVTKRFTMDYGLRVEHISPWEDAHGQGFAVFDPALYAAQTSVSGGVVSTTQVNPGYTWHSINHSIPNSGAASRLFFFEPRFGLAYDFYGNGQTMFRGGIGLYRSHDAWNDVNQAQATAQGQAFASVGGGGLLLSDVPTLAAAGLSTTAGGGASSGLTNDAFGLDPTDSQQPLTYTYSFTLSQQVGPNALFELAYQGSQSDHLFTQYEQGAPGDLENIDALPIGALFHPDPLTGEVNSPQGFMSQGLINNFRKYPFYSQVNVARHILYGNYNGMQVSFRRNKGRFQYNGNYTWSKNLGILGSYATGNVIDSGNIRPNYGPLATDRSQVINANYSFNAGSWYHGAHWIGGLVNGWELSQIFNLQSGPDVQRVLGSNFNLTGEIGCGADSTLCSGSGLNYFPVNNLDFLGTPDVVLQPKLLCDPRTALAPKQHLNGACFALPDFGVNGPAQIPYIHAPGYFDADARLGNNFHIRGSQELQLQLSAFNVINRPNYSFSTKFPTEQTLNYISSTLGGAKASPNFGYSQFRFGRRVTEISIKYNF